MQDTFLQRPMSLSFLILETVKCITAVEVRTNPNGNITAAPHFIKNLLNKCYYTPYGCGSL
jgi:hypothetical protein